MQKSICKSFGWSLFLFFASLFRADSLFAQWGRPGDWPMGPGMMGSMGWVGALMMLVFWILLIVGLILLIKWLLIKTRSESAPKASSNSSALEILKERYARGEIDKEEFEEKKKDLLA